MDPERRLCVADNIRNGFNLFNFDSSNFITNLLTLDPKKTYPNGVLFANKGNVLVRGSDHGIVYIFDTNTSKILHRLLHTMEGGVEAIAVSFFCDN